MLVRLIGCFERLSINVQEIVFRPGIVLFKHVRALESHNK